MVGAADYELDNGDEVLWYYGKWDDKVSRITVANNELEVGETFEAHVEYYENGSWHDLNDATVYVGSSSYQTDNAGLVQEVMDKQGIFYVYAEKDGYVRTNTVKVVVTGTDSTKNIELETEVVPAISFEVRPDKISFGKLGPGYTVNGDDIVITNTGSWDIVITATISQDSDSLFDRSLYIDGVKYSSFSEMIEKDTTDFENAGSFSTELRVPTDYSDSGLKKGSLIIWAEGVI